MKLNKSLLIMALSLFAISGLFAEQKAKKDEVPGVAAQPASYFYTGKPYDADLGAYTFNFRTYNPELKRWTSADPSGFRDSANNYIYVNNACVSSFDATGLYQAILYSFATSTESVTLNNAVALGGGLVAAGVVIGSGGTGAAWIAGALTAGGGTLMGLSSSETAPVWEYAYGEIDDDKSLYTVVKESDTRTYTGWSESTLCISTTWTWEHTVIWKYIYE